MHSMVNWGILFILVIDSSNISTSHFWRMFRVWKYPFLFFLSNFPKIEQTLNLTHIICQLESQTFLGIQKICTIELLQCVALKTNAFQSSMTLSKSYCVLTVKFDLFYLWVLLSSSSTQCSKFEKQCKTKLM